MRIHSCDVIDNIQVWFVRVPLLILYILLLSHCSIVLLS
jgi:hypothetical protein